MQARKLCHVALGSLMVLSSVWYHVVRPMRAPDARVAFTPLAVVPVSNAEGGSVLEAAVSIPDNPAWSRIRRQWGDPEYLIGYVRSDDRRLSCLEEVSTAVRISFGQTPLELRWSSRPPYGYSAECQYSGMSFRFRPGSQLQIHIQLASGHVSPQNAAVVVIPYWTSDIKDRLVGLDLSEKLRGPINVLGILGAVGIALSIIRIPRASPIV
jgi:hypothetical protein